MRTQMMANRFHLLTQATFGVVLAFLVMTTLVPSSFAQKAPAVPKEKTLYQRMGGYDVIAEVVDGFIGQLKTDPAFKRFGGGRSMSSLMATRQLVVDQLCNLTGGPCIYIGRPMKMAHDGLEITPAEWDSSMKKWKMSLDKAKVGEAEQKEFLDIISGLRKDIVEKPKKDYPKSGESMKKD